MAYVIAVFMETRTTADLAIGNRKVHRL